MRIQKAIDATFAAIKRADISLVMQLWSDGSPWRPLFERMLRESFPIDKDIDIANVKFGLWRIDPPTAQVTLQFDLRWHDLGQALGTSHEMAWQLRFVKRDSKWYLWAWRSIGAQLTSLGNALIAAQTKSERESILKEQEDIVLPILVPKFYRAGYDYMQNHEFDQADRFINIATEIAEKLGDRDQLAWCYMYRGGLLDAQTKKDDSLIWFENALAGFEEVGDKLGMARAKQNIGAAFARLSDYARSLDALLAALKLAQENGDEDTELDARRNLASVYHLQGENQKALDQLRILEDRRMADKKLQVTASELITKGELLFEQTEYWQALDVLLAARKLAQDARQSTEEALANKIIGDIFSALGDFDRALAQYDLCVPKQGDKDIFIRTILSSDKEFAGKLMTGIGNAYMGKQQYTYASAAFWICSLIAKDRSDREQLADALANSGVVFDTAGDRDRARQKYEDAAALYKELNLVNRESPLSVNLGFLQLGGGNFEKALTLFESARVHAEAIQDTDLLFRCYWGIGDVHRLQQQWEPAITSYRAAVRQIEQLRIRAGEPMLATSFLQKVEGPYYNLAASLLADNQASSDAPAEAFKTCESAKARTLTDLMARGTQTVIGMLSEPERTEEAQRRERVTRNALELQNFGAAADTDKEAIRLARERLNKSKVEYDEFWLQIYRQSPKIHILRDDSSVASLVDINQKVFANDAHLCVLSYMTGEDGTLLFVLRSGPTPDSPAYLRAYPLVRNGRNLTSRQLTYLVMQMSRACATRYGSYAPFARELYEWLLAPAISELKDVAHIVIVPDGVLYSLPFAALLDANNRFLIEKSELSYAPSMTALITMMALSDHRHEEANTDDSLIPMLAFGRRYFPEGRPELRWAEIEATNIANLFGKNAVAFTGNDASKDNLSTHVQRARKIHLATHGEFNSAAPMYSGIALSGSPPEAGFLTAQELAGWNLGAANLVVFSTCDSARGQQVTGEGLLGIASATFMAGSPAAIVSQWSLNDNSASVMMQNFYQRLLSQERVNGATLSPSASLQAAQADMLKLERHPYSWASFMLIGDWRN